MEGWAFAPSSWGNQACRKFQAYTRGGKEALNPHTASLPRVLVVEEAPLWWLLLELSVVVTS